MTYVVRERMRRGKPQLEIDIHVEFPDGTKHRERRKPPVSGKANADRWARQREAEILRAGPGGLKTEEELAPAPAQPSNVPTVATFAPTWIADHAKANGNSLREIESKESILRIHVVPHIGSKRLDDVSLADIQKLKVVYRAGYVMEDGTKVPATKSTKTINNRLTVLAKLLKCAHAWGVMTSPPPPIEVKAIKGNLKVEFYETPILNALVKGAESVSPEALAMLLLGADAGLRRGEIIGLNLADIDFPRRQIYVQRQIVDDTEVAPKGGKCRYVPMTTRLAAALKAIRHLRGPRALMHIDRAKKWRETSPKILRMWMQEVERASMMPTRGALHILRHTFCSHLAMRGAPVMSIMALAGHEDIKTTLRYMHLCAGAKHEAIALLDVAAG